jgi:histidine triad (HIT) family protein
MQDPTCVFCQIVAKTSPAEIVAEWPDTIAIAPLDPVTPGHRLIIPKAHVGSFIQDPQVTATTAARAAELADELHVGPANLITSAGWLATQSVFHLHFHLIPRRRNDRIRLPWHSGKHGEAAA